MRVLYLILAGVAGGVLGAMGLGGGTLLMPILTFLLGISPKVASWVNLVAFLPAATVAVCFYARNKLIDRKKTIFMFLFSLLGAATAFLLGRGLPEVALKKGFGWTLILLGSLSLFLLFIGYCKKKHEK